MECNHCAWISLLIFESSNKICREYDKKPISRRGLYSDYFSFNTQAAKSAQHEVQFFSVFRESSASEILKSLY